MAFGSLARPPGRGVRAYMCIASVLVQIFFVVSFRVLHSLPAYISCILAHGASFLFIC